jgi:hypothetical protein
MSSNLHNSWRTDKDKNPLNANEQEFLHSILGHMGNAYPARDSLGNQAYPTINRFINERRQSIEGTSTWGNRPKSPSNQSQQNYLEKPPPTNPYSGQQLPMSSNNSPSRYDSPLLKKGIFSNSQQNSGMGQQFQGSSNINSWQQAQDNTRVNNFRGSLPSLQQQANPLMQQTENQQSMLPNQTNSSIRGQNPMIINLLKKPGGTYSVTH